MFDFQNEEDWLDLEENVSERKMTMIRTTAYYSLGIGVIVGGCVVLSRCFWMFVDCLL